MSRFIISILLFILPLNSYSDNDSNVEKYTRNLVSTVSSMLQNPNIPEQTKLSEVRALLRQNLDFQWMANFTVGPYSYYNKRANPDKLSKEQQDKFTKVYTEYVIAAYTDLVKEYKGQKSHVTNIREIKPGEFIVSMTINGESPIRVKYLVRANGSSFKVSDIITEEVSLISNQQAEFISILSNGGFDELIHSLQAKSR